MNDRNNLTLKNGARLILSHKRKERLRKQRNQSIRWFIQDTLTLLIVAAAVYTIGILLIGISEVLL